GMRTMLAAAVDFLEQLLLVKHVIVLGGGNAPQAARLEFSAFVDDDVEAVEGPEQAVRFAELDGEHLDLGVLGLAADGGGRDAIEAADDVFVVGVLVAALIGDDESAL